MITTLLTANLWLLITTLLLGLPNAYLPPLVSNAITSISAYLAAVATILPLTVSTLLTVLGLMVGAELAIAGYKGIMWFIHRVPGQGGGSTS